MGEPDPEIEQEGAGECSGKRGGTRDEGRGDCNAGRQKNRRGVSRRHGEQKAEPPANDVAERQGCIDQKVPARWPGDGFFPDHHLATHGSSSRSNSRRESRQGGGASFTRYLARSVRLPNPSCGALSSGRTEAVI